jgi:hypothetical protein
VRPALREPDLPTAQLGGPAGEVRRLNEQSPVGSSQARLRVRSPQYRDLVTKHEELGIPSTTTTGPIAPASESDQDQTEET